MGRILAIDYGKKRVGLAVTDPLKIFASGLDVVSSIEIFDFIENYIKNEEIECFVVGQAFQLNNKPSESSIYIEPFVNRLKKLYPTINIVRIDERFTSKIAFQTMIEGGLGKKQRQNKELVDKISATLILQTYLEQRKI